MSATDPHPCAWSSTVVRKRDNKYPAAPINSFSKNHESRPSKRKKKLFTGGPTGQSMHLLLQTTWKMELLPACPPPTGPSPSSPPQHTMPSRQAREGLSPDASLQLGTPAVRLTRRVATSTPMICRTDATSAITVTTTHNLRSSTLFVFAGPAL